MTIDINKDGFSARGKRQGWRVCSFVQKAEQLLSTGAIQLQFQRIFPFYETTNQQHHWSAPLGWMANVSFFYHYHWLAGLLFWSDPRRPNTCVMTLAGFVCEKKTAKLNFLLDEWNPVHSLNSHAHRDFELEERIKLITFWYQNRPFSGLQNNRKINIKIWICNF